MSATELVCASPSQQRLRRSSDSVAAPSQQRCAHHERSTGQSKIIEQPVGKICHLLGKNRGTNTTIKPCEFNIILPKELRPLPCQGKNHFWGGLFKRAVFGYIVTHRIQRIQYLLAPHTLRLVLPTTGWVAAGRQWPALLMPRRVTRAVNEAFTANGRPRRTAPMDGSDERPRGQHAGSPAQAMASAVTRGLPTPEPTNAARIHQDCHKTGAEKAALLAELFK